MSDRQSLENWRRFKFAPPPEADLQPLEPSRVKMVPMRDGVHLYTELFFPKQEQTNYPVILIRSPYPYSRPSRHDEISRKAYVEAGYIVVFQLTRGQYRSEGRFRWLKDEMNDGYDCIDWIARQSWCNGNVGMQGVSYLGSTQLLAAKAKPLALKCIMPAGFLGSPFHGYPFYGGIIPRGLLLQWHRVADTESMAALDAPYGDMSLIGHPKWGPALRKRPLIDAAEGILTGDKLESWRDMVSHAKDDSYWDDVQFSDLELGELDLPIFFIDGWLDLTLGTIDYFQRMERIAPKSKHRYLLVGPWDHGQVGNDQYHDRSHGERGMPANASVDFTALTLRFFDRYLKVNSEVDVQSERVHVYITGANVWRHYPTFPAPDTHYRRLYLHSEGDARSLHGNGSLSWKCPGDEVADSYIHDPATPMPSPSQDSLFDDRRALEMRSDGLVYTTVPLDEPLTILGEITLVLHAASDGPDTDWFAQLTEVYPDGRSVAFHGPIGVLRARYHRGFERESLLVPGKPTKFVIRLSPAGHQIAVGNRLRLHIFSACFPLFDANTNTGKPPATDTQFYPAYQSVFHNTKRPSHIILPTISI